MKRCPENGFRQTSHKIHKDIEWLIEYLPKFNGISILWLQDMVEIDASLASDASLIGGGATFRKQFIHFKFSPWVLEHTSNIAQREMLTILVALRTWGPELRGQVIRFSTDNENYKFAINLAEVVINIYCNVFGK